MFGSRNLVFATLLLYIVACCHVHCDDNLYVTIEEVPEPGFNTSVLGPPGPVGLVGLPGPKGTRGSVRACQCDIKRVRRQQALLDGLRAKLFSNAQRVEFDFKQNPDSCSIGLKTGRLNDSAVTASSFASQSVLYAPYRARLDNINQARPDAGAWIPSSAVGHDENWIQVELDQPTEVSGVITQGLKYGDAWISSYKISYSNYTGQQNFIQLSGQDKIFIGNHDRSGYKINMFSKPITARYFRLYVVAFRRLMALRMEFLTC